MLSFRQSNAPNFGTRVAPWPGPGPANNTTEGDFLRILFIHSTRRLSGAELNTLAILRNSDRIEGDVLFTNPRYRQVAKRRFENVCRKTYESDCIPALERGDLWKYDAIVTDTRINFPPDLNIPIIAVSHHGEGEHDAWAHSAASCATHLVAVSDAAADAFGPQPRRVAVIPQGIEFDRLQRSHGLRDILSSHNLSDDVKIILWPHRFTTDNRPNFMLDVAECLDPAKYHVLMVGDGPEQEAVFRRFSRDLPSATMAPYSPYIGDYYGISDCVAVTSLSEGSGIQVFEAWATEKPVVMSEGKFASEIIGRHGDAVLRTAPVDSPVAFAEQIEIACGESPEFRASAKIAVGAHYSAAALAYRWETFIATILKQWNTITVPHAHLPPKQNTGFRGAAVYNAWDIEGKIIATCLENNTPGDWDFRAKSSLQALGNPKMYDVVLDLRGARNKPSEPGYKWAFLDWTGVQPGAYTEPFGVSIPPGSRSSSVIAISVKGENDHDIRAVRALLQSKVTSGEAEIEFSWIVVDPETKNPDDFRLDEFCDVLNDAAIYLSLGGEGVPMLSAAVASGCRVVSTPRIDVVDFVSKFGVPVPEPPRRDIAPDAYSKWVVSLVEMLIAGLREGGAIQFRETADRAQSDFSECDKFDFDYQSVFAWLRKYANSDTIPKPINREPAEVAT